MYYYYRATSHVINSDTYLENTEIFPEPPTATIDYLFATHMVQLS